MKAPLYSVALAVVIATPVLGADISLVGTWTGQRDRVPRSKDDAADLRPLVITEQQGNTFTGRLKRSNASGDVDEALWGAFTPGGKLMMGSDEEGTYIFSLINPEHARLLLQRDRRFSAISVCETDPWQALNPHTNRPAPPLKRWQTRPRCAYSILSDVMFETLRLF